MCTGVHCKKIADALCTQAQRFLRRCAPSRWTLGVQSRPELFDCARHAARGDCSARGVSDRLADGLSELSDPFTRQCVYDQQAIFSVSAFLHCLALLASCSKDFSRKTLKPSLNNAAEVTLGISDFPNYFLNTYFNPLILNFEIVKICLCRPVLISISKCTFFSKF